MATNNSSQQRLLLIAAVVVVALLAVNAFLLYNKYTQGQTIDAQEAAIADADKLKIELEKQYQEALSELEEMRGNNDELNSMIDQQKAELKIQRDKIDKMISGGGELTRARAEMSNLKSQVQQYVTQIQELKAQNETLSSERDQLTVRTQSLTANLDSANLDRQRLEGEKATLSTEKSQLSEEKLRLEDKVNLASVIKIGSVSVTPLKERNSGKTVKKEKAKNVDQLKICFRTTENRIVRPSAESFFVRILNPVGETMSIDELGGGQFRSRETGEDLRYTYVKEYDYNNDEADICFNWDPNLGAFAKGKYKVEVYNKGHISGRGEFSLK